MAEVTLDVEVRNETGKGAGRRLRRAGKVPGVVYGKSIENLDLQMDAAVLQKFLQSGGSGGLVQLKYGGNSQVVLVKDLQTDPVMGQPLHIDFHAVSLDEDVQVEVPIVLTGEEERETDGGIVSQSLRELSIACLPTVIPESISLDISALGVGDSISAGDVPLPAGVTLSTDAEETVVSIVLPRAEAEEDEDAEEGATEAEAGDGEEAEASADGDESTE